jgi:hypothetical protein
MITQVHNPKSSFLSNKFARAVVTGALLIALGATGLSNAQALAGTVSSSSTLTVGQVDPQVVITSSDFNPSATIGDFLFSAGTTGLQMLAIGGGSLTISGDKTTATFVLVGTVQAGTISITVRDTAFELSTGIDENSAPISITAATQTAITGHVVAAGSATGSTKVTYTAGAGNSLKFVKQSGAFTAPNDGDDASAIGAAYTSGADITSASAGQHVGIYEVDGSNLVVAFIDITLGSGDIKAAATQTATPPSSASGTPGVLTVEQANAIFAQQQSAAAAAEKAKSDAAAKLESDRLAAEKAVADKLTAEKAAAEKAALEKVAAEKEAADKAAAEVRAAAEAVVKAEEARVAAAEAKAAAVEVMPVATKSGTKITLDLPDKYYGKIVTIYVGTTVKGKTAYKKLDYFVLDKEDGTAEFSTMMKLKKGQTIQVKVGSKVVKSVRL